MGNGETSFVNVNIYGILVFVEEGHSLSSLYR